MEVTKSCIMNRRLAKHGYNLFSTSEYGPFKGTLLWRKFLKRGRVRIDIDTKDCTIKAYTIERNWIGYGWREIKVKNKWVKDIDKYIILEVEALS